MLPTLHTPEEVAQCLQISVKAVHELCRAGRLAFVRVNGKERRFTEEDVQAYIKAQTVNQKTIIDKRRSKSIPSRSKGKKMVEGGTDLGKEIRQLCQ